MTTAKQSKRAKKPNPAPTIKTFVLATNREGFKELLSFDVPVAGKNLAHGEHHEAALKLARASKEIVAAEGLVAFDEHDPAGALILKALQVQDRVPRVVIDASNGLVHSVDADHPVEVWILDEDVGGGDKEEIHEIPGRGQMYCKFFCVSPQEADDEVEFVANVFAAIDESARARQSGRQRG